jgi:hypothetical protein
VSAGEPTQRTLRGRVRPDTLGGRGRAGAGATGTRLVGVRGYYLERIGAAAWPGEAVLMAATIAVGLLMLLMPYLAGFRRPRPA